MSSIDGDNASRPLPGLPHLAHQQIAKYELPLPRGPAVQSGRPPHPHVAEGIPSSSAPHHHHRTLEWTDGASRLSVCGDAAASAFVKSQGSRQHISKLRVSQERPLLSPVTDLLCRCVLQPWQVSHSTTHLKWRERSVRMLLEASCVAQPPLPTSAEELSSWDLHLLALDVTPLRLITNDGHPQVVRSISHRPCPTTYRTAWSLTFLHALTYLSNQNTKNPDAVVHPSARLRPFFPNVERNSPKKNVSLLDDQRLLRACLTLGTGVSGGRVCRFQPSHAVVFALDAHSAVCGTPVQFECIAGWARWSALVATLEGIRMKTPIPETFMLALETRLPIYVIDSSLLSRTALARLSACLNLADMESSANSPPMPCLPFFLSTQVLKEIRSRPFTLCDRLWSLHHILVECDAAVQESPDLAESQTLASLVYKYITSVDDWHEFTTWLHEEAQQLAKSAWAGNPLVVPLPVAPQISDRAVGSELLLCFMLSLAWPVSSLQLMTLTFGDVHRIFGTEFPFGPLELSGRPRSGVRFWDDLLLHYLPHQIQANHSLTDLYGITRTFEVFFTPRCGLNNMLISTLEWWQVQDVSLVQHFSRNDTSAQFISRIVEHSSIPTVGHNSQSGSYEQLAAFICMYSLHFCLELEEKALRGFGRLSDTSATEGSPTVVSNGVSARPRRDQPTPVVSPSPSSSNETPSQTPCEVSNDHHRARGGLPEEPVTPFATGASRVLHLIRACLLFATLTCDNPYQIQEIAHRQQQHHILPLLQQPTLLQPIVLLSPHPGQPVFTPFAALFAGMNYDGRKQLEEHFELLLGALAELLFRECLGGLAREDLFTRNVEGVMSPLEALRMRCAKQEAVCQKSVNLTEFMKGGGILVQSFFRACWGACRNVPPRTFAVIPDPGDRETGLTRAPVSDIISARMCVYEHLTVRLSVQALDAISNSVYAFVPRILGPLYRRRNRPEVSTLAEGVICGDAIWTILRARPDALPMTEDLLPPVESSGGEGGAQQLPEMAPRLPPEVMRSRGLHEQEVFSRICRLRFEAIAVAVEMAEKRSTRSSNIPNEQDVTRLVKQELAAETQRRSNKALIERFYSDVASMGQSGATTTAGGPSIGASSIASLPLPQAEGAPPLFLHGGGSTTHIPSSAAMNESASPPVSAASSLAQNFSLGPDPRGAKASVDWFEDRKIDVRRFLIGLYREMKTPDCGVSCRFDFRDVPVEEAKQMAQPLTDLAADSPRLSQSLKDVPFQLEITRPEVLTFSRDALNAVRVEVEETLRIHLDDGFRQLLDVPNQGHSVVASARPAVICAFWQTLVHLPPHLDVLFPLALRWNHVRAIVCAWLWGELRKSLDEYWRDLCKSVPTLPESASTCLRWSLRCLPSDHDTTNLNNMPDLTSSRLLQLLSTPKTMDRICCALYRFQCSGMATVGANGKPDKLLISPEHLERIFVTSEASLKDTFSSLWARLPRDSPIEVALHDPEIASAGFLKRYAPLILGSLDELDHAEEIAAAMQEVGEPPSKRRRREALSQPQSYTEDGEEPATAERGAITAARRRPADGLPAGVSMVAMTVQHLRKELRQRPLIGGRRRRNRSGGGGGIPPPWEIEDEDDVTVAEKIGRRHPAAIEWLRSLPTTITKRLQRPTPCDLLVERFEESYFQAHAERRAAATAEERSSSSPPDWERSERRDARVGGRPTDSSSPTDTIEDIDARINRGTKMNGCFPSLPEWLEAEPMWQLWRPALRRPEGLASPFPRDEDYTGDYGIRRRLSLFGSAPPNDGDLSDRDWALIKTVLEFLHLRGIDTLYSSTTQSIFHVTTNERSGGMEWRKELDESAEVGAGSPSVSKPPARMVGGLSLRRYLDGWSADPDPLPVPHLPPTQNNKRRIPLVPTAPSAIKELNDQIVL